MFQSDQFKYAMTEVVQKCLQPLEEKMEKRLRRLEKIYNEKADQEEEERSVEPEVQLIDLEMVKVRMEGDENSFLHVFLSTRKSSLYELMSDLNSPNIFFPAERAKLRRVKITLPVFSIDTKTDLTTVLEKVGIEGESLLHEAHFQLNQSGVNVPHVPSEEVPPEPINPSGKEKTIDFLANRPFLFMLTKSDHVMYIGCSKRMDLFKSSDQLESVLTRVVQKCLQPLEEKMEKRLRRLERIYNDKADREEEEGPIEYEKTLKGDF
ncbi:unnamed protein product [Caenorhabditis brenneri]